MSGFVDAALGQLCNCMWLPMRRRNSFDDGDTYFNLPVSADDIAQSGGNKMEIVSGGVPTAAAQVNAQQRRLSAKQKKAIAASIVPPTGR